MQIHIVALFEWEEGPSRKQKCCQLNYTAQYSDPPGDKSHEGLLDLWISSPFNWKRARQQLVKHIERGSPDNYNSSSSWTFIHRSLRTTLCGSPLSSLLSTCLNVLLFICILHKMKQGECSVGFHCWHAATMTGPLVNRGKLYKWFWVYCLQTKDSLQLPKPATHYAGWIWCLKFEMLACYRAFIYIAVWFRYLLLTKPNLKPDAQDLLGSSRTQSFVLLHKACSRDRDWVWPSKMCMSLWSWE